MKKMIALLTQEPEVSDLCRQISQIEDRVSERMLFIKKQADDLFTKSSQETRQIWNQIECVLKKRDLIPSDYSSDTHYLKFSLSENYIALMSKKDDPSHFLEQFLEKLLEDKQNDG